jgi:hypothetical protein
MAALATETLIIDFSQMKPQIPKYYAPISNSNLYIQRYISNTMRISKRRCLSEKQVNYRLDDNQAPQKSQAENQAQKRYKSTTLKQKYQARR